MIVRRGKLPDTIDPAALWWLDRTDRMDAATTITDDDGRIALLLSDDSLYPRTTPPGTSFMRTDGRAAVRSDEYRRPWTATSETRRLHVDDRPSGSAFTTCVDRPRAVVKARSGCRVNAAEWALGNRARHVHAVDLSSFA